MIMAILLVGVRVIGLNVYTVLSGSMEPTYHTGSLIYVKKVDYKDLPLIVRRDVVLIVIEHIACRNDRRLGAGPDLKSRHAGVGSPLARLLIAAANHDIAEARAKDCFPM